MRRAARGRRSPRSCWPARWRLHRRRRLGRRAGVGAVDGRRSTAAAVPRAARRGGARAPTCCPRCPSPAPAAARSTSAGRPGVPTVLNLWGSWCAPCREELPVMQQFADAAGGQVRVMGVISKDGRPQAESFAADAGVTFPSAVRRGRRR